MELAGTNLALMGPNRTWPNMNYQWSQAAAIQMNQQMNAVSSLQQQMASFNMVDPMLPHQQMREQQNMASQIETALQDVSRMTRPTPQEMTAFKECITKLQEIVRKLGNEWKVAPFGSAENGFGSKGSDLDVTCYHTAVSAQDSHRAVQELKLSLAPLIQNEPRFRIIEEVWSARVPILKLQWDAHLDVDLSCHNRQALQNTRYLKCYASMNPLIRNFVLVIKQWAKFEQVCGATIRHLSTYSFTLMAIFFLQVHPGLHPNYRLPCISTASFDIAADPGDGTDPQGIRWDMDLQLSQVVWDFFHFYTNEYNWSEEVVSVRLGRRVSRYDPEVSQLAGHVAPRLHIEDPFLLERNLNCVLGSEQEEYLQDRMRSTFASLASWRMPPAFVMKQPKPLRQQAAPFPAAAPKHEAPRLPQAPETSPPPGFVAQRPFAAPDLAPPAAQVPMPQFGRSAPTRRLVL